MNCDQVRELVSDSLDGILAENIADRFDEHLKSCAPCRAFRAELQESLCFLEELPVVEVGGEFDEGVWRRIREMDRSPGPWQVWKERVASWAAFDSFWKWSPVGVAAAILMMMVMSSGPGGSENRSSGDVRGASVTGVGGGVATLDSGAVETGDSEEAEAGMPEAIEAYLVRSARDLRLQDDGERFRRSNYSYPLRRVQVPSPMQVTDQHLLAPRSTETEPEVIAF